jgi:hypothetical protein
MARTITAPQGSSGHQESKRQRFERLAQRRVTDALNQLRLIGNLANRGNYDYTDDHVRQIVDALESEMRHLRRRFQQQEDASGRTFAFRK